MNERGRSNAAQLNRLLTSALASLSAGCGIDRVREPRAQVGSRTCSHPFPVAGSK